MQLATFVFHGGPYGRRPEGTYAGKGRTMKRNALLAVVVLLGAALASLEAQTYRPSAFAGVEGRWFYAGNPRQPCYIEAIPGGFRGPRLILTNERGEQSEGRLLSGGGRIIAYDWGGGGLV